MAYNTKRYEVVGDWSENARDAYSVLVVADLRDKRTGDVWREGAYRVLDARSGVALKTFFGETAWSDAERYFTDRYFRYEHARAGL